MDVFSDSILNNNLWPFCLAPNFYQYEYKLLALASTSLFGTSVRKNLPSIILEAVLQTKV